MNLEAQSIYYDDQYASVEWDAQTGCVIQTWKKFVTGEAYQKVLNKITELVTLRKCPILLADTRQMSALSLADQQWTLVEWAPKMAAAGHRVTAVVMPEKMIAQITLKHMTTVNPDQQAKADVQLQYFSEIEAAKAWISQNKAKYYKP